MAKAGFGSKSESSSAGRFAESVKHLRREAGRTVLICAMAQADAETFLNRIAKKRCLRVNGFRPGTAPLSLLYRAHRRQLEQALIRELRDHKPDELTEVLKAAFIPPQFRVLPWIGGDFEIEVAFYTQPGAPVPGAMVGGAARERHDEEILQPRPGGSQAPPMPGTRLGSGRHAMHMAGPGLGLGGSTGNDRVSVLNLLPKDTANLLPSNLSRAEGVARVSMPAAKKPVPQAPEQLVRTSLPEGPRGGGGQATGALPSSPARAGGGTTHKTEAGARNG